jgi:hypothetical protein
MTQWITAFILGKSRKRSVSADVPSLANNVRFSSFSESAGVTLVEVAYVVL